MNLDNDQYRIIVESSPNMIWRSGKDTLCNYFNTTWLNFTGRSLEQEMGVGWAEGVHPEDYETCLKIYLDAFAKEESFEMEYRLKRNDSVIHASASFGLYQMHDEDTLEKVIIEADKKLYEIKKSR